MWVACVVLAALVARESGAQDEDGPYRGAFIGKLNSYHHQVSGEVYAVDDWTLLLVNFNYDGTGDDTFFWAGETPRPGPQGYIVPDEHGKTNILERYYNAEVRLSLPEGKRVSRATWLAVYDLDSQNTFGDVYVPEGFEPPAPRALPALAGSPAVSSQPVTVLTADSLLIPELRYDGSGEEVYFWAGVGPQPANKGFKIPDEYGYLEPLRAYGGEEVRLWLPGGRTVFDINWLSVWDAAAGRSLAAVLIPEGLNVPPSERRVLAHRSSLPACKQLHRDLQVSWEVFGPQVTIELAATLEEDEYMAFGISGNESRSVMEGADVAVARWSAREQRGLAADYAVSARAACLQVLGRWTGVCRDDALGGTDSNQVFSARRADGLTVVSWRRTLAAPEPSDLEWRPAAHQPVVWALGALDAAGEPSYHALYPRADVLVHLNQQPPPDDCFSFTAGARWAPAAWETPQLFDPALRVFTVTVGPAGGPRGTAGRPGARAAGAGHHPLAFYVNGQLAPDLQLRRGLTYTFKVLGGNDPHSAEWYHPLVVTGEPRGGLERLSESAQRGVRVLAGVHVTRRGRLAPLAAGGACRGQRAPGADPRRDADYDSFRAFNRSLRWQCAGAVPADLTVTPNSSWPDLVYYQSFTHAGMGGRIFVVDRHKRSLGRARSAAPAAPPAPPRAALLAALLALAARR